MDPVTAVFNFLTELIKTTPGQALLSQLVTLNAGLVGVLNDFIMHVHGTVVPK